jgi:hypothetical protein
VLDEASHLAAFPDEKELTIYVLQGKPRKNGPAPRQLGWVQCSLRRMFDRMGAFQWRPFSLWRSHVTQARALGRLIDGAKLESVRDAEALARHDRLLRMFGRETRAFVSLGRSLRLNPHALTDKRTAGIAADAHLEQAAVAKPWGEPRK